MVTNNPILQMFARSPFKPIQEHIQKAQVCAAQLLPFFQAVIDNDWERAGSIQHTIAVLEGEADALKKEVRQHLPSSLFLPVPRTDLLELLRTQDKIANRAKDICGIMLGRKMPVPEAIQPIMLEFVRSALATAEQAHKSLNELDELIGTGFRGREVDVVERMLLELDELEHKNDELERQIRAQLFQIEKEMHPIDAIFLYKVINWIGDLADRAQQVGSRLQLLLAR